MTSSVDTLQSERIRALEVQVESLQRSNTSIEGKLDELLELKSKGMGAFWLASIIVGAIFSLIGSNIFEWLKG